MSMLEPEPYVCYHCKEESLKITVYSFSIFKPLIFRTDGSCANHPVHTDSDYVLFCPHCEKFLIGKKLKRGRDKTPEEKANRFKPSMISFFDIEKKYFTGSKKWNEEMEKSRKARENEEPDKLRWFGGLHSCREILFALKAEDFLNDEDVRYQLRLNYWRENNRHEYPFDDDPNATPQIYEKLMEAWDGHADERYMYRAELLRNTEKFKKSNELLKNPEPKYEPVIKKYKKWAKVIRTMNGLKYKRTIEINV